MRKVHTGRRPSRLAAGVLVCVAAGVSPGAHAIGFQSDSGDWVGSWDTTIGYGQGWRVEGRDCRLIAMANGGCAYGPNIDDGDLNYGKGTFSEALTGVTEFSLKYRDRGGVFFRADGLYDFWVMGGNTDRTPLTHYARDIVGSYVRILDAFGYLRFNLGSMPSEFRFGEQVVDWGESTFIAGGLNQVTYFDVNALTTPGSELKQALLPDTMARLDLQITKNVSAQLLYLFSWHEDLVPPTGSYFGTNDSAVTGGNKIVLGFGAYSDQGVNFTPLGGPFIPNFQNINRLPDHVPSQSGQYGANLKFYLPDFGQGTQLGLYFLNYSSRLPVVSVNTGTQGGLANGYGAVNAVSGAAQALAAGLSFQAAVATGAQAGVARAHALGGNLSLATATQYATIGANTLLAGGNVNSQAQALATNEFNQTQGYYDSYPQNIKMLGLSFNTEISATGTALQGEVAYRHNVPLQLASVGLVYASLTPFESGIAKLLGEPVTPPGHCVPPPSSTPITGCNQLGAYGLGQTVQGYELKDTWQFGMTATQTFANVLKASQAVIIAEAALDYVPNFPAKYTGGPVGLGNLLEAPGATVSGVQALGGYPQFPNVYVPGSEFPTATSWGYVLLGRLEYDNLIASWNVLPRIVWSQDVNGISPGPGGNFINGRHAATFGVEGNLRNTWVLDVSYSHYGGAGAFNLLDDRDFVAASIKYSF
jgi:hypothetical protein